MASPTATSTPYVPPDISSSRADHPAQANILIDHNCHPRLVGYGLPFRTNDGLDTGIHMEKSDIFAFGPVTYRVGTCF